VKVEGGNTKEFAVKWAYIKGQSFHNSFLLHCDGCGDIGCSEEGHALIYVDGLVLICKTKKDARWIYVA